MSSQDVKDVLGLWYSLQAKLLGCEERLVTSGASPQLPFLVANFVRTWGRDGAMGIVERAMSYPHNGRFNGEVLGERLFMTSEMRTYQNQLHQEHVVLSRSNDYSDNYL